MDAHTGALFNSGPIGTILDLTISAQESKGETSVDDELKRFCRMTKKSVTADWLCPPSTVSATLEFVADMLDLISPWPTPPTFEEKLARAAGSKEDGPEYLRTLAGIIRVLSREGYSDYDMLSMAPWEAKLQFTRLLSIVDHDWIYDCDYASFEEYFQGELENEHPYCPVEFSPLAAEIQEALVLFPDVSKIADLASLHTTRMNRPFLQNVLSMIEEHLHDAHGVDRLNTQ